MSDADYQQVRDEWPDRFPPITRVEAERAARKLVAHFAPKGWKRRQVETRRVWISPKPTRGHWKGWGRLIHDVSHTVFRWTYPSRRPHDPLHVHYETEIAKYVAQSDWLEGGLKPPEKKKPTLDEKRAKDLERTIAGIKRWTAKARRADTALRKLNTKKRRLESLV